MQPHNWTISVDIVRSQAVEDLCLHKMAAGLYERLQKVMRCTKYRLLVEIPVLQACSGMQHVIPSRVCLPHRQLRTPDEHVRGEGSAGHCLRAGVQCAHQATDAAAS